ncbi:LamG-like jellyroll fold domain-containing protein [Flavobacterium sp.]|uniref:LamG-like jellyroll fold domain-containing protein n=1 Tax=Flavobacterium sp. TaxID=239 RepID=UPI003D1233EB
MKKNIFTSITKLSWILLCFLQLNFIWAQTSTDKMSVLKMYGDANHYSFLDTNIDLKTMVLDQGTIGQGTLEFWAKFPSNSQKLVLTTDAPQNKKFSLTFQKGQIAIVSAQINTSYTINPSSLPVASVWQHFAITLSKGYGTDKYNFAIYVDGVRVTSFNGIEIATKSNIYFTKGQVTDEIMLTEIRAWNTSKTDEQLALNRFISYFNYNATAINTQVENGLIANYSGPATTPQVTVQLPELSIATWTNTVQKAGYPTAAKITATIKNTKINKTLADINTSYTNPIEELKDIVVNASKGKYNNKIDIQWFHAREITYYTIYRDGLKIGTLSNIANKVGEQLNFVDTDVLPGTLYTYKVEGNNSGGTNFRTANGLGFIFPNGSITGLVKTQSDVYVDQVGIEIGLSAPNSGINGAALAFSKGAAKVTILDRQLFTENNNTTIEFWYKNGNTTATMANTVFKLATTEINMLPGTVILNWGNSNSKSFALGTADTAWHHYAFTLGANGIEVFKDGISIGSAPEAYFWNTSAIDMNAYLNYTAGYDYAIDEFRVWSEKKSPADVAKFAKYVVDSDEKNLAIAYSFDFTGTNEIYNHALNSRGSYVGKSEKALSFTTQPSNLKYITFTDANGNYNFNTLFSKSANGNDYNVVALKPNHEFRPATIGVTIKQSTLASDYSKVANFTDISELPIAGNILYKVNGVNYPVPAGKKIAIDGKPLLGVGTTLESNIDGVYSVSSSLGRHTIEVYNPELTENKTLNSISFSPTIENGKAISNGYASTKKSYAFSGNGITFSAAVKPYSSAELPNYQPEIQSLIDWGKFSVFLVNNNTIQFWYNGNLQAESAITIPNDFNFFSLSIAPSGNYGLLVNDDYKTGSINSIAFTNEIVYTGATVNDLGVITKNCVSNISNLQIRNKNYSEAELRAIKNGEIITNETTTIDLAFEMDQEKGTRLISKTKSGFDNYLVLQESAKIDTNSKYNCSKKYNYAYIASNALYNPTIGSANYNLNVVDPLTSVNFEMTTRYGFIGNIVVPCDNNIGVLTGTIKRTDVVATPYAKTIGAENFDLDNKVFKVDDLVPGQYQVTLTNADGSIKLVSPIIDLTKGWKIYDFEYRSPLLVEVNAYVVKDTKITTPLKDLKTEDFELIQKACSASPNSNDFYVLKEGNSVLFQAVAYEKYGDQKCLVPNANITFSGDLLKMPDGTTSVTGTTDQQGRSVFTTYVDAPNFIAPFLRTLTVQTAQDSRSKIITVKGFVEGAKMNQSDFTIDDPIVDMVVHDPPGDASSATLKKGSKTVTTGKWKNSLGYTHAMVNKVGAEYKQDFIYTVMGVGTSITASEVNGTSGLDFGFKFTAVYNGTTVTETETFTDITTSTSENLVGKKADLFVGKGYLITVGRGEVLRYDTTRCAIDYQTDAQVLDNRIKNVFVHSYYDIQKNMIPNLLTAYTQETDSNKKDSYENSVLKWIEVLLRNDYTLNDYKKSDYEYMKNYPFLVEKFNSLPTTVNTSTYNWANYSEYKSFDKNRSFDGGGATTTASILKSNVSTNSIDFDTSFDLGYKTNIKGKLGTVSTEIEYKNIVNIGAGGGYSNAETDYTLSQFKLSDNDAGDRFAIEVKKDPYYKDASPIFKTIAGKSSCPAEKGTQLRNGVEIVAESATIANGLNTEVLKYNIKLRNTQTADNQDSSKTYKLSVPITSNPYGASVTINGSSANGALFTFGPDPSSPTGIKQEIAATVEIKMNANDTRTEAEYKDIQLAFSVPCEEHNDIGYTHNADVYEASNMKSIDYLYLTAQFHGLVFLD